MNIMWTKRLRYGTTFLLGVCLSLWAMTAEGRIAQKNLRSMVVRKQGILPGSRMTEVVRLDVVETDTSTPENPIDDGAATLQSLRVRFENLKGTQISELSTVALYRIGQPIDDPEFDFQRDFDFRLNRLVRMERILSHEVVFDNLNEEILNTHAKFFIAITTDVSLRNNNEFAVRVWNIVLTHPASADPLPDLAIISEVLTCVDFAGDLMPEADYIRPDGIERDFPFSPHNYSDFTYVHPDALNDLFDLEIPTVIPAESPPIAVLGIEMAGVRSELQTIRLNFISNIDGVNNDGDFFIDEDFPVPGVSRRGVFDPFIDEIVRDNDGDGFFSVGDEVLYYGFNGVLDAERRGFDDDGDGMIDEEQLNAFRSVQDGFIINEDFDYYVDENGDGRFTRDVDELYRDIDQDGRYAGSGTLDILVDTDGLLTPGTGNRFDGVQEGDPLEGFPSDSTVSFTDRNLNNKFEFGTDILLYDEDLNGKVTLTPDILVDTDGTLTPTRGTMQEVRPGMIGKPLQVSDQVYADSVTNPTIVWQDRLPYNGDYDTGDSLLIGTPSIPPGGGTVVPGAVNVATINPQTWYYHDRNRNQFYDPGDDIYINVIPTEPQYSETSEAELVIYAPAGASPLVEGEKLVRAANEPLLVYYDANHNGTYDDGEDIFLEAYVGRSYTTVSEGVHPGQDGVFSLDVLGIPGARYSQFARELIDEDHGYTPLHHLVNEDLQNWIAWFDDNNNGVFDIIDLDGDGDFFPVNEDLNNNGILDPFEDINGDGNLDLGISGDEIYIDYNGDGLFNPNVGGQLHTVSELWFAGDDPTVRLRAGNPYTQWLEVDEDGDGERGGATIDSRWGVAMGLFPNKPPFTLGIPIPIADGIDNDGDGFIDEGINEDMGDSAFDAFKRYNNYDRDISNDILVSDIERILIYRDNDQNRNGIFDPHEDILISRHDPEVVSWRWVDIAPPYYTAEVDVFVSSGDPDSDRKLRTIPVTDDANYDFFVVIYTDGDDAGDVFPEFGGVRMLDGRGLRHGDDFQVSLARDGIITTGGKPNAKQITKPIESIFYMGDMIGYVGADVQADDGRDEFIGNPYFDATSSPIAVVGLNIANSPAVQADGRLTNDVLEQVRVHLHHVATNQMTGLPTGGVFDILKDGTVVTLPDLMPLADDSTGGVGLYMDDDTPPGDGIDNDGDGLVDEELLNGLDDDGDGLIDEDVGDGDPAGINGVFDPYDDPVPLRNDTGSPLSYRLAQNDPNTAFVDLNLTGGAKSPPNDTAPYLRGFDYYVVLRTSDQVDYQDTWKVSVKDHDVRFRSGRTTMNTGETTHPIAANVPVFLNDLTRPEPGRNIQTIQANSEPTAVVGINLYDRNLTDNGRPTSLEYIRITFDNVGDDQDFTPSDLMPISTVEDLNGNGIFDPGEFDWNGDGIPNSGRDSGVALYRDSNHPNGKPGVFDETDELVYIDGDEIFGNLVGFPNTIQLNLDRFGDQDGDPYERIPANDEGDYKGDDYFVVIRTSSAISNGDDFRVRVSPVVANGNAQWPMHFKPVVNNGIFTYTYSYESIETNVIRANTQTNAVFSNLVEIGQRIEADSAPTAVLGINVNDGGGDPPRRLNQVRVRIYPGVADNPNDDVSSGFDVSDLNPFSNTVNSGLAIYRDVKDAGRRGIFDPDIDERLNQTVSSYTPVYDQDGILRYVDAEINLSPGVQLPPDDMGENFGPDFFVVVRTSRSISFNDQFSVRIPKDGLFFESGESYGNQEVTTRVLTSNVPVFFSDRTNLYARRVGSNSPPRVAVGLNMNSGTQAAPNQSNESIRSMVVQFNRENDSAFTNIDIAPLLMNNPTSGIALYRDNSAPGSVGKGQFNEDEDIYIPLSSPPRFVGENEVMLTFDTSSGLTAIPPTDTGDHFGADFFVVFRTSSSITRESQFSLTVKDIRFETLNSQLHYTTGVVTGADVNQPPSIELITPVLGDRASSEPFAVRWEAYDDGDAFINLYYMDNDRFVAQGIVTVFDILTIPKEHLVQLTSANGMQSLQIPFRSANRFDWDVRQVAIGDKRVIAIITDERQAQSAAYSPGPLTITNELPTLEFTQPDGVGDVVVRGTPYTISWVDEDPENNARIDLFLMEGGVPPLIELPGGRNIPEDPDGIWDTYQVATTNLRPATYVPVAYITDGVMRNGVVPVIEVICDHFFTVLENTPPEITLLTPDATQSQTVFNGDIFEIRWTAKDDDSSALISLYYDLDRVFPGDATPIVQTMEAAGRIIHSTGIPAGIGIEDPPDYFLWDVSQMPAGKYYVMARIDDGVNPPVERYSPSFVIIDKKPTFQFVKPDGFDDSVIQGMPYLLTWLAKDPDSNAAITLYLDNDRDPNNGRGILISRNELVDNNGQGVMAYSLNTAKLPLVTVPTQYYPLAMVVDGNNDPLLVHAEYPITILPNQPPTLDFIHPNEADSQVVQNADMFLVQWTDLDPDFSPDAPPVRIELYYSERSSGFDGIPMQGYYETVQGSTLGALEIPFADDRNEFHWDISQVPAGIYYVFAILRDGLERPTPIVRYSAYPVTIDKLPNLIFIEPDGVGDTVVAGATYELVWVDSDPDSNARIDFYLSTIVPPNPLAPGVQIASGIMEDDEPNRLAFSTAGLEPGRYYPVAIMKDIYNPPQMFTGPYPLEIIPNATPSIKLLTPPAIGAVAFGDTFVIRWIDSNRDNAMGDPAYVNLFYDTDDRELNGIRINPVPIPQANESKMFVWNFMEAGVKPGTYYLYATIEDTSRKIIFDYSDGPLIIPESGTNFHYGMHVLNRTGGVTSYDTSPERTFDVDFAFADAVNIEPNADGTMLLAVNAAGEVKVAVGGVVLTEAEQLLLGFERRIAALPSLPANGRRIIDLEFDISGKGYYLLDNYGKLYASAGVPNPLTTPGANGLFGFDIARDFEITPTARGGYILTGDGAVIPLGDAPTISTPYFGWDIARDIEVVAGGYYMLDGLGGVYAVGEGVPAFSSPYFGIDVAKDLVAVNEGGYYILFDTGKIAVGGNRLNLPTDATSTPIFDTGITHAVDMVLSGDIHVFFSEDLIAASVNRFEEGVRQKSLSQVGAELSALYNDGVQKSKAAKMEQFRKFFEDPNAMVSEFGLSNIQINLSADTQEAIVNATTLLTTRLIEYTTQSVSIDRNAVIRDCNLNDSPAWISTRNQITPILQFDLASDQEVVFERFGDAEQIFLYLDRKIGEFGSWQEVTKFGLSQVRSRVLNLTGGCGCTYRVILVNLSCEASTLTQPLGFTLTYSESSEEVEQLPVAFQYAQDAPGDWKIRAVNLPPQN